MAATLQPQSVNPQMKRLVYSKYREMLGSYNDKANSIIQSMPAYMVTEDKGFQFNVDTSDDYGTPPAPAAPVTGSIPSRRLQTQMTHEPPACVQNAMLTKDKKPFTYTPGGIDLSQIKSPRMAKRIARNAQYEGITGPPKPSPLAQPISNQAPLSPSVPMAASAMGMPVQVFPTGPPPPPPHSGAPPPPPPMKNTLSVQTNGTEKRKSTSPQNFEPPPLGFRPEIKIPPNPMASLKRVPKPQPKDTFWIEEYRKERSTSPTALTKRTNKDQGFLDQHNQINSANSYAAPPPNLEQANSHQQGDHGLPQKDYTSPQKVQEPEWRKQSTQNKRSPSPTKISPGSCSQPETRDDSPFHCSDLPSLPRPLSPIRLNSNQANSNDTNSIQSPSDLSSPTTTQQSVQQKNAQVGSLYIPPVAPENLATNKQQQQQELQLKRQQELEQQRIQEWEKQREEQIERVRQEQFEQQRQKQLEQQRQQQLEQQRKQQIEQQRQQQLEQQRQQQLEQQRKQQLEQQRQQQLEQQRQQQLEQQRQQQVEQQRQQQLEQQRQQQLEQQRQQQLEQQRQLQLEREATTTNAQTLPWMSQKQNMKEVPEWIRDDDELANNQAQSNQNVSSNQINSTPRNEPSTPLSPSSSITSSNIKERIIPIQIESGSTPTPTATPSTLSSSRTPSTPGFGPQPYNNSNQQFSSVPSPASGYISPISGFNVPTNINRNANQFVDQGYNNYPQQWAGPTQNRVMSPPIQPQQQQQPQWTAANRVASPPIQLSQQKTGVTRIIPITIEGQESPFNPNMVRGPIAQTPTILQNDPRTLQHQNSRGNQTPNQSKSFRILQQITDTEPANERNDTQSPSDQIRRMQLNDQETPFANRGKNQAPMSMQSQKFVPNRPGYQYEDQQQQPYIHPSEQQVPEPKKYTGSAIPSRSFKLLQAMTTPENAAETEGSGVDYEQVHPPNFYPYPYPYPPPPHPHFYPPADPNWHYYYPPPYPPFYYYYPPDHPEYDSQLYNNNNKNNNNNNNECYSENDQSNISESNTNLCPIEARSCTISSNNDNNCSQGNMPNIIVTSPEETCKDTPMNNCSSQSLHEEDIEKKLALEMLSQKLNEINKPDFDLNISKDDKKYHGDKNKRIQNDEDDFRKSVSPTNETSFDIDKNHLKNRGKSDVMRLRSLSESDSDSETDEKELPNDGLQAIKSVTNIRVYDTEDDISKMDLDQIIGKSKNFLHNNSRSKFKDSSDEEDEEQEEDAEEEEEEEDDLDEPSVTESKDSDRHELDVERSASDYDDADDFTEDADEIAMQQQLSVIYEESETDFSKVRRDSQNSFASTLSDCPTTIANDDEDSIADNTDNDTIDDIANDIECDVSLKHEMLTNKSSNQIDHNSNGTIPELITVDSELDNDMNLVTVRLPLKFSFSKSLNDENITTVVVGDSEIEDEKSMSTSFTDDVNKGHDADVSVTFSLPSRSSSIDKTLNTRNTPSLDATSTKDCYDSDSEVSVSVSLPMRRNKLGIPSSHSTDTYHSISSLKSVDESSESDSESESKFVITRSYSDKADSQLKKQTVLKSHTTSTDKLFNSNSITLLKNHISLPRTKEKLFENVQEGQDKKVEIESEEEVAYKGEKEKLVLRNEITEKQINKLNMKVEASLEKENKNEDNKEKEQYHKVMVEEVEEDEEEEEIEEEEEDDEESEEEEVEEEQAEDNEQEPANKMGMETTVRKRINNDQFIDNKREQLFNNVDENNESFDRNRETLFDKLQASRAIFDFRDTFTALEALNYKNSKDLSEPCKSSDDTHRDKIKNKSCNIINKSLLSQSKETIIKVCVRDKIADFEGIKPIIEDVTPVAQAATIHLERSDSQTSAGQTKTLSRNSSLQKSESEEIEEDDSGVTSDMSKAISETDTESECFPELKKMTRYQRAATHSRLFKLLQDEATTPDKNMDMEDDEEKDLRQVLRPRKKIVHNVSITRKTNPESLKDAETMSERRERLSLPLKPSTSIDADNLSSSNSPSSPKSTNLISDKLVNELVQSLLLKNKSSYLRNLPMEKLQAAAKKVLEEDLDSLDNTSLDSTPALTPQEFKNEYQNSYADYYETWNTNDTGRRGAYDILPSKAFKHLQEQSTTGHKRLWAARCPRVLSSKTINRDLSRVTESRESESPDSRRSPSQTSNSGTPEKCTDFLRGQSLPLFERV